MEQAGQVVVYSARNLVNNHWYIGYTGRGMASREQRHRYVAKSSQEGYALHKAIRKYGQENFMFEVLHDFEGDEDLAKLYECEMIAKHKPEYNLSYGGEGGTLPESSRKKIGDANRGKKMSPETLRKMSEVKKGKVQTPETRRKIALANTGRPSGMLGKVTSEETRAKLRAANKGQIPWSAGKQHSAETKQKMSAWQQGRKLPDEHRQSISEARRLRSKTPSEAMKLAWQKLGEAGVNSRKLAVKCVEDGKVFTGSSDADRFYGFRIGLVSRIVKGTVKNSTGKTFVRYMPGLE